MLRYETLFLTVPEITGDEASTLEQQLEKAVKENRGSLLSFDRWGKYRLAYPIRKNEYGVYFLARFETSEDYNPTVLEAVRTMFSVKNAELVMRHMVAALDADNSLMYQRPESLEEVPARDVDSFLKENKMTGLLGKSSMHASSGIEDDVSDIDESDEENL